MKLVCVTQEDIDKGVVGDCQNCPVARAMQRIFGPTIRVGTEKGWLIINGPGRMWDLPEEAITFIDRFDSNQSVAPLSFNAEVPGL